MERPAQRGLFTEIGGLRLQQLHSGQSVANDFTRFFQENIQKFVFHLGDDNRDRQGLFRALWLSRRCSSLLRRR